MTSQQLGDIALAEHRAVMAVLYRECISRPTQEQYDRTLSRVSEAVTCTPMNEPSSLSDSLHSVSF
jgi:hypothetical protein